MKVAVMLRSLNRLLEYDPPPSKDNSSLLAQARKELTELFCFKSKSRTLLNYVTEFFFQDDDSVIAAFAKDVDVHCGLGSFIISNKNMNDIESIALLFFIFFYCVALPVEDDKARRRGKVGARGDFGLVDASAVVIGTVVHPFIH